MSVGDMKGSRRRIKRLKSDGNFPKASGLSVSQSIDRNRETARRMAAASVKRSK